MSKPSMLNLLTASDAPLSFDYVMRASLSLYGYIGAGLDERDWDAVMTSDDPLSQSIVALIEMYQDPDFLLRNASYLLTRGYSANQIVFGYRKLENDIDFTLPADWAEGTMFEEAANKSASQLLQDATSDFIASVPVPSLTVTASSTAFTITSSVDGTLEMVGVGSLGAATTGANVLTTQAAISTGTITVNSGGRASAATTQTFTLGTTGADTIDTSGAGARVDYVLGGNDNDTITTGDGDDWILGGDGDDVITAGNGADRISAGDGNDTVIADENDIEVTGGDGTDTLRVLVSVTATRVQQFRFFETVNLEADGLTFSLGTLQFMNATINGFATGSSTIAGSNGNETINGGSGNDTLSGGTGNDIIDGKGGNDTHPNETGNDTYLITGGTGNTIINVDTGDIVKVSAGAAVDIDSTLSFVATADTVNLGGQASDFEFQANQGGRTINLTLATVATAATDGFKLVSTGLNGNTLIGSSGDDILENRSSFGSSNLRGGAGDDTITGFDATSADIVTGGLGADTIDLNTGNDTVVYTAVNEGGAVGAADAFAAGDTIADFTVSGAAGAVDKLNVIDITNVQNVVAGAASFESVASGAASGTNTVILITGATATSLTDTSDVVGAIGDFSANAAGFATGDVHIFIVGNTAADAFGIYAYTEADGAASATEGDLRLLGTVSTAVTGFDADNVV